MKVIIVEDEQHNSRMLHGMLKNIRPEWEVVDIFESIKSTVSWLNEHAPPDLIFMDIQLTDGICFSIFDQVEVPSMVIFTTAYDEYAIQAFKVNSIDYLLKPIKTGALEKAIDKFEDLYSIKLQVHEKPDYHELLEVIKNGVKKYRKRLLVSGPTSYFKIDVKDIAYFYKESRVTIAVTFDGREHALDLTMEKLEEELDPEMFFRANRSIILNTESVSKFENYFGGKLNVKLVTPYKEPIIVSRLKATTFKNWLDS